MIKTSPLITLLKFSVYKYSDDIVSSDETEKSRLPEQLTNEPSEVARHLEHMRREIEQLKDINRALLIKLDQQYEYIKEQDQQVMELLQEYKESKQLLLEIKEEQPNQGRKE